jgi:hypothetical protein
VPAGTKARILDAAFGEFAGHGLAGARGPHSQERRLPAVARHAFDQARVNPGVFRLLAGATLEHTDTVRDWIADMVGRIAGQHQA